MRRTSSPGRADRRRERGSIVLDALIALLIAALALTSALGGLALAARTAGQRWQPARAQVGERNDRAASRPVVFEGK